MAACQVVLEVKEVEAKSSDLRLEEAPGHQTLSTSHVPLPGTDEDEKQILKGLNLTIKAGEAQCSDSVRSGVGAGTVCTAAGSCCDGAEWPWAQRASGVFVAECCSAVHLLLRLWKKHAS